MYQSLFRPKNILLCSPLKETGDTLRKVQLNLKRSFKGELFFVKPNAKDAYHSVSEILDEIDLAILALPVTNLLPTLRECGAQGVKCAIILNTTQGGRPISRQLKEKIIAVGTQYGMHILGPRSGGFFDGETGLNASLFTSPPQDGIALISQSLHRTQEIITWAKRQNFGFSKIFTLGERAGITENELLLAAGEDSNTKLILLCLESFADEKNFLRLAQMLSKRKNILLVPSGTIQGSKFSRSQSFQKATESGVLVAHTLPELLTITKVLVQTHRKKTFLSRLGL